MKSRIIALRKKLGLSQIKFGEKIGATGSSVQKWELGLNCPSDAMVSKIAFTLGVNETWLRTGEGDMDARNSDPAAEIVARIGSECKYAESILRAYLQLNGAHRTQVDHLVDELLDGLVANSTTVNPSNQRPTEAIISKSEVRVDADAE